MAETNTDTGTTTAAAEAPAAAAATAAAPKAEAASASKARRARRTPAAPKAVKAAPKRAAQAADKGAAKTARRARTAPAAPRTRTINATKTVNEGTRTMKNEANKVADRFQAVFGDVNARAKTTIERNTRIAEELTELGRGNVEALVASTKIAAKAIESIGQDVAEYGRKSFEDASAALRGFAEIKSPADFFRLQTEFVRAQFDNAVAESSKLSETVIKLAGDVAEPINNRYTVAAERVRTAVAL
ncbi:MAG TPA: phasin family protein [Allosphingosinicella sp.]|jgi:phasin family protein